MGHRTQTHCVNGHPFDAENTRWEFRKSSRRRKAGWFRQCRTCHNEATKLYDVFKRKTPKKRKPYANTGPQRGPLVSFVREG